MLIPLQRAIWDADLPPHLKLTLLAFADFINSETQVSKASLGLIAWMVGKTRRNVQADVAELERRQILIPQHRRAPTYGRVIPYAVNRDALRSRPPYCPTSDVSDQGSMPGDPPTLDASIQGSMPGDPPTLDASIQEPWMPASPTLDASITRSVHDLGTDLSSTRTPPPTAVSHPPQPHNGRGTRRLRPRGVPPPRRFVAQAKAPADDGNYRVVCRVVRELLKTGEFDDHGVLKYGELKEAAKGDCAVRLIDYGNDPAVDLFVIDKAIGSEWLKYRARTRA